MSYMFPAASVSDRYLVTFVGTSLNNKIMNTFWYRLSSISTPVHKGQAMDELENAIDVVNGVKERFLNCMPGNYTLDAVWVQPIDQLRYVKQVYPKIEIGTSGQPGETNNLQGTIVRRGVEATREAVGALRLLLPTSVAVVNDGLIESTHLTKMQLLADEMEKTLTVANNNVYVPVIRHGVGLTAYIDIGECFTKNEVRVLRRRTLGVGI